MGSSIERRFFSQSQAVNVTANRLASQQARDKSIETDEVNLLAENQSSPILIEGRAEADEMRRQASSALTAKKSMHARNENFRDEYYAQTERKKFQCAPGISGGH